MLGGSGTMKIWRAMTVPKSWFDKLKSGDPIGKYWSWSERAAYAHWGHHKLGNIPVKIGAIVKEYDIDWKTTLQANIMPLLGEDEKEITLIDGFPLTITSIKLGGKDIDLKQQIRAKA